MYPGLSNGHFQNGLKHAIKINKAIKNTQWSRQQNTINSRKSEIKEFYFGFGRNSQELESLN